jgi:hypothetical protein
MITHLPRILSRLIVDDEVEEDDGRTASTFSAETITATTTTAAAAFYPIIKCSCSSAADCSNSLSSNINDEEEEGKNAIIGKNEGKGNHSRKAMSRNEEEGEETPTTRTTSMLVASKGEPREGHRRRILVGNKKDASNLEWKRPNCPINRRRRGEKNIVERSRRGILFALLLLTLFPLLGPTLTPWTNVEAIRCYCTG